MPLTTLKSCEICTQIRGSGKIRIDAGAQFLEPAQPLPLFILLCSGNGRSSHPAVG